MMLPRKRQRPNPTDSSSSPADTPATPQPQAPTTSPPPSISGSPTALDDKRQQMQPPKPPRAKEIIGKSHAPLKQVHKSQSWYGSWPRGPKAPASTSVARENIFGGSFRPGKAPDLSRFDMKKDNDENGSIGTRGRSASDLPATVEDGKTRVREDGDKPLDASVDAPKDAPKDPPEDAFEDASETLHDDDKTPDTADTPNGNNTGDPASSSQPGPENTSPQPTATSSGWLGWWYTIPVTDTQTSSEPHPPQTEEPKPVDPSRPSTPVEQTAPPEPTILDTPQDSSKSTSWFGFWPSSTPSNEAANPTEGTPDAGTETRADPVKTSEDVVMSDAPDPSQQKSEPPPKAGSTWAFWSRDSLKPQDGVTNAQGEGEIAVIGEGSEAHPLPMNEGEVTPSKDSKNKKEAQPGGRLTWGRNNKRLRPQSMDMDSQSSLAPPGTSTPQEKVPPQQQPGRKPNSSSKSIADSEIATKSQMNLLLPSFASTYQMKQDPSILKQIAQLVLRTQQTPVNHVLRVKDPPEIRKAIAIGVHGLIPATYLRPMIGQPTGTSLRFANLCADAIRRWADSHGSPNCDIEKVALEGEGKIQDRVENLWKLMLNWIEHIRHADLILIACHSQGVPVSIMLVEKLIDLGIITNAKIGVCAMAGVGLGPFPEYKSSILMGSTAELWDFGNPESTNSQRFEASLKRVLDYGARITFIGSIDDQLVPMESAIYSPANHPYIYRAVFIDGRVHAPDFIAHLIGFALKLRNLGVSDHGLIRELSVPLAGSLYSGEGHSRLYYDDQVYDLAVSHALETTSIPSYQQPKCEIRHRGQGAVPGTQQSQQQSNPYVLPWIMRGLLEEEFVKTELSQETAELLRQFDDWKPSNKALKDVKYRLEAVRSKL